MIKKFKAVLLCLVFISLFLSGCEEDVPVINNERDWTIVIEDENADPSYLEIEYRNRDVLKNSTVTFVYNYQEDGSYYPKFSLRYKNDKTYYFVKPTGTSVIRNGKRVPVSDINSIGEYRVTFGIFKNDKMAYPFEILASIIIEVN